MASENERKATGNAGANSDDVEIRDLPGEQPELRPEISRRGERHAAGADTPAGPNPRSTTENAKGERDKQEEIAGHDRERQEDEDEAGKV